MDDQPRLGKIKPEFVMSEDQRAALEEFDLVEHSKPDQEHLHMDYRSYSRPETDEEVDMVVATVPAYNLARDLDLPIDFDDQGRAFIGANDFQQSINEYYSVIAGNSTEKPVFFPNERFDIFEGDEKVPVHAVFRNSDVHATTLKPYDRGAERVYAEGRELFEDEYNWSEHMDRWEKGDSLGSAYVPVVFFPEKLDGGLEKAMPRYTTVSLVHSPGDELTADYNPRQVDTEDEDDYDDGGGAIPAV